MNAPLRSGPCLGTQPSTRHLMHRASTDTYVEFHSEVGLAELLSFGFVEVTGDPAHESALQSYNALPPGASL